MKRTLLNSIFLLIFISIYSQNNDTTSYVKAHNLDEIIVKGENSWIEGDKYIFIPQKKIKIFQELWKI